MRQVVEGTILEVSVKPKAKRFKIALDGNEVIVFCRESPRKGKVNLELVRELSKIFCRRVEIVSGFRFRQKKLLVRDIKPSEVEAILSKFR